MLNELGALLKYEFRYYFRFLLPICLLLILGAVIIRLKWNPMETLGLDTNIEMEELASLLVVVIGWVTLIGGIVGMITTICIILRFINNFMKDSGSLMFTLPVSSWTLIAAKIIAAFCISWISIIAVCVSTFILAKRSLEWVSSFLTQTVNMPIPNSGEIMIIAFILCAMTVAGIGLIYVAITVSYLLPRFRFVVGCAVYIAISSFLEQPIFNIAIKNTALSIENLGSYPYANFPFGFAFAHNFYTSLIPLGVAYLAFAALYFFATGFLLKRTLNLE
jgi:hypothetical protein